MRKLLRLRRFSYRFAEQVLNSKLTLKQEIESILTDPSIDISSLSRPRFNEVLKERFVNKGWESQPSVFDEPKDPSAKMDFMKERIGIEVGFGHASFIGIDLLKFQVASYSGLNKIDIGVYIVTTRSFQKKMTQEYGKNWAGSLSFEKVARYLPHFKSAIQLPIYVIGVDL
ncbi:MAG: restriction endonuclease [Candidatus Bathyarchaeota archaeon]|nr:restriction endonuclease [Candidatus Bathyarchaeota archaeon]